MGTKVRLPWLDITRLLAMALVAVQHILSACDIQPPAVFFQLDPGQLGVAAFFAVSGFLAVLGSKGDVGSWLSKRLSRVFVPYWIAVTGVLLANYAISYKPVSGSMIISEYLGLVGWTHRETLVGVHFWFVSLLLFCYVIGAVVRFFPKSLPLITAAVIAWLSHDPHYAGHTLAFLTGIFLGQDRRRLTVVSVISITVCGVLLASIVQVGFACISVGAVAIGTVLIRPQIGPNVAARLSRASNLSYHFYLVHGPIYLAVAMVSAKSVLVVSVFGTAIAVIASLLLEKCEIVSRSFLSSMIACSRAGNCTKLR